MKHHQCFFPKFYCIYSLNTFGLHASTQHHQETMICCIIFQQPPSKSNLLRCLEVALPGVNCVELFAVDLGVQAYPTAEAGPVEFLEDRGDDTGGAVKGIAAAYATGDQPPQLVNTRMAVCLSQIQEPNDSALVFCKNVCHVQHEVLVLAFSHTIIRHQ